MKKTYICPQIEEMKLNANYTLLAGSVTEEGDGGSKRGVSIFGDSDTYSGDGSDTY